jgi:hypothetical protein
MSTAEITVLGPADTAAAPDLARLLAQVSSRGTGLSAERVREVLQTPATSVLVARLDGRVNLTSRPSRAAANGLYQSLGFTLRATNCYRYDLNQKG